MRNGRGMLGKLALCALAAGLLALAQPGIEQGRIVWNLSPAWACGLGQTATMMANASPALAYPLTPQSPPDAPIGVFGTDYYANQSINFTEDLSKLPSPINPNDYQWHWSFSDGATADGYKVTHTFTQPGSYRVQLDLNDPHNAENDSPNFDSATLNVIAQPFQNPPVARATGSGKFVQMGSTLSYDASNSQSQVGGNLTYTWNFGDTTVEHGPRVTHMFTLPGNGFVALIVQDQRGAKAMTTIPVDVVPELPKAAITASATSVQAGADITFDASGSTPLHEAGDVLTKYQWDFGDGGNRTTARPKTLYNFAHPGTYTVTVQAIDQNGFPGTASMVIHVTPASQTAFWPWATGTLIALALLGGGYYWYRRYQEQQRLALAARKAQVRHAKKRH